jgi:predicted chitinase
MLISFPFLPDAGYGSAISDEQAALSEIANLDDYESVHGNYLISRGDDQYFNKYEPDTDQWRKLGNTRRGDGKRFKGRRLIQITGRESYAGYGRFRELEFISDAGSMLLQSDGYNTCDVSGYYWVSKQRYVYNDKRDLIPDGKLGINYWADLGFSEKNIVDVTKRINPGLNHLYVRRQCFMHALCVLGDLTTCPKDYDAIEGEA